MLLKQTFAIDTMLNKNFMKGSSHEVVQNGKKGAVFWNNPYNL